MGLTQLREQAPSSHGSRRTAASSDFLNLSPAFFCPVLSFTTKTHLPQGKVLFWGRSWWPPLLVSNPQHGQSGQRRAGSHSLSPAPLSAAVCPQGLCCPEKAEGQRCSAEFGFYRSRHLRDPTQHLFPSVSVTSIEAEPWPPGPGAFPCVCPQATVLQ